MRGLVCVAMVLMVSACNSVTVVEEPQASRYNVDGRLLTPEGNGVGAAAVEAYTLAPFESFRMPRPLHAPSPQLPPGSERRTLPPTTVCVDVILDVEGKVQRSVPLLSHSSCAAGTVPAHQDLLQAAVEATAGWHFEPAALCHFAAGISPPAADDCTGAARVEPVPVTLPYAFTFEVRHGQVTVDTNAATR